MTNLATSGSRAVGPCRGPFLGSAELSAREHRQSSSLCFGEKAGTCLRNSAVKGSRTRQGSGGGTCCAPSAACSKASDLMSRSAADGSALGP